MKVQTLGEFEESLRFDNITRCFAFVKYRGKWKESIVVDYGNYFSYSWLDYTGVFEFELITMVYKPEPPE